jgi:hypothetical protein
MSHASTTSRYPVMKMGRPWQEVNQCKLICIFLGLIVGIAAQPAKVSAKPGYEVRPASVTIVLPVKKGTHYVASISASQQKRVRFLFDNSSSSIEYSATGHVSDQRIDASYGSLGHINVGLHLTARPPDPSRKGRCKGRAPSYREGSYSGTINISTLGLGSVVPTVAATHGHVYFIRRFRRVCKKEHINRPLDGWRKLEVSVLAVEGQTDNRLIQLQATNMALRSRPDGSVGFLKATVVESIEGVRIIRTASSAMDHESFILSSYNTTPETAAVEPPHPFMGQAVYSRSPGAAASWSGDLSVQLPGVGDFGLTGPGFHARLCRAFSVVKLEACR